MASADFWTRLGAVDALRPTIFELVDEETLITMVKPALRTVVSVFAPRYPRYLLPVYNRFEELYALLTLFIEKYYLDSCDGTFGENFYGLKRMVTVTAAASRPSQQGDRLRALAVVVLIPYLRSKLDELHERQAGPFHNVNNSWHHHQYQDTDQADETWTEQVKRRVLDLFVTYYPYVKAVHRTLSLAYQIAYLYGVTRYYSPWLHLLRQEIKRLSMSDVRSAADRAQKYINEINHKYAGPSPFMIARRQLAMASYMMLSSLQTILPMAIFFYKFLQWWYSSEYVKSNSQAKGPVPPPPTPLPRAMGGIELPEDRTLCPLCKTPRTNATVIPSGYVYCFTCIFAHVQQHGMCPVTLEPTSVDQLRKIYAS